MPSHLGEGRRTRSRKALTSVLFHTALIDRNKVFKFPTSYYTIHVMYNVFINVCFRNKSNSINFIWFLWDSVTSYIFFLGWIMMHLFEGVTCPIFYMVIERLGEYFHLLAGERDIRSNIDNTYQKFCRKGKLSITQNVNGVL